MEALTFRAFHRYPDGFTLDASFEAGEGVTALFGPSGSGKSTVLHAIAGTLRPDSADVRLGSRHLIQTARGLFVRPEKRRVGLVHQDALLFPHLTVRQNLVYGLRRGPLPPGDLARLVDQLEVGPLLDRRPHTLSGGERQRVALGRALLRGPECLLLDEPLAALDAPAKRRVLACLERVLAERKLPVLFVSHDQTDVRRIAERVVVLAAGRVAVVGPTAATLDRRAMGDGGLEAGPVNLLRIEDVRRGDGGWTGRLAGQVLHLPGELSIGGVAAHVRFLPKDVILSRGPVSGVSIRNHLAGSVREVITVERRVFVAVDCGQFLWAEVTPEAAAELELRAGLEVVCLIKAAAIHVL